MAKIEDALGTVLARVDATQQALRVTPRPMQAAGYYRFASVTGLLTAVAAQGELMQFRWASVTHLALIQQLRVRAICTTAFTAAQEVGYNAATVTGWTVNGTGGTDIVPNASNLMKRTSFPQSQVASLRFATTAALGAGTKTIFGTNFWEKNGYAAAVGAEIVNHSADMTDGGAEYPIVLQQNEGIILRNGPTAMGAAGLVKLSVEIAWAEVLIADFPNF